MTKFFATIMMVALTIMAIGCAGKPATTMTPDPKVTLDQQSQRLDIALKKLAALEYANEENATKLAEVLNRLEQKKVANANDPVLNRIADRLEEALKMHQELRCLPDDHR